MTVAPQPPDPLDDERRAAQTRLEAAVGEGRLTLDEFTDRCGRVWSAADAAQVHRILADLPAPVVGQSQPARYTLVSIIGDIRRRGRWSLRRHTRALLLVGDVELDLRNALIAGADEITIDVYSLLGDVTVIAPEGVEVELTGFSLIGDRRVELAPVPRVPGTPTVRVRAFGLIGEAKVRSAR